jgi:hypothetical protein
MHYYHHRYSMTRGQLLTDVAKSVGVLPNSCLLAVASNPTTAVFYSSSTVKNQHLNSCCSSYAMRI